MTGLYLDSSRVSSQVDGAMLFRNINEAPITTTWTSTKVLDVAALGPNTPLRVSLVIDEIAVDAGQVYVLAIQGADDRDFTVNVRDVISTRFTTDVTGSELTLIAHSNLLANVGFVRLVMRPSGDDASVSLTAWAR